jgi:hypothetical protein
MVELGEFRTFNALKRAYWVADERHDYAECDRLGGIWSEAEDAERARPATSNKDAAAKLRIFARGLDSFAGDEKSALLRVAKELEAPDSPRRRFEQHRHLQELELLRSKLLEWEPGNIPLIEAAITWLGRPRVEHCPEEGMTIFYAFRGVVVTSRYGVPVPAELSHLPVA